MWRAAAIASVFAFSTSGLAATIQNVADSVSLNSGSGFKKIAGGTPAAPGDLVMASSTGSATIVYENGCVQTVQPGTTVHVLADPQCQNFAGGDMNALVLGGLATAVLVGGITAITGNGSSDDGGGGNPGSP